MSQSLAGAMNADLFFLAIDIAGVVCAALLAARMLIAFPRALNAQLIALLCVAAICHIVLGRYDYSYWIAPPYRIAVGAWQPALNLLRNLSPGLFMILAFRLFADRRRMPAWLLALFAVQMLLEALPASLGRNLTQLAPTLLQLLFVGFAIYWTIENWRADLVDARRRVRAFVAMAVGCDVVVSSLLLRVVIPPDSRANYRTHLAMSLVNLALITFLLLRMMRGGASLYLGLPAPQPARRAPPDPALPRLLALLEYERVWRQPNLTLKNLATRLALPEYRLRRLIHEGLGYRNFNAFLHEYRIREACTELSDPAMRRTPILTIALSVGYQSLNTFNRGFREVMGMTPSAWRAGNGAMPRAGHLSPEAE